MKDRIVEKETSSKPPPETVVAPDHNISSEKVKPNIVIIEQITEADLKLAKEIIAAHDIDLSLKLMGF